MTAGLGHTEAARELPIFSGSEDQVPLWTTGGSILVFLGAQEANLGERLGGARPPSPKMEGSGEKPTKAQCFPTAGGFSFRLEESSVAPMGGLDPGPPPANTPQLREALNKKNWETMRGQPEKQPDANKTTQKLSSKRAYGTWCRRDFNIDEYMAKKPPYLGDSCVLFSKFGRCFYGVGCRFAGAHLGKDHRNLINQKLWEKWKRKPAVKNRRLTARFRDCRFPKSNHYFACVATGETPASGKSVDLGDAAMKVSQAAGLSPNKAALPMAAEGPSCSAGPGCSVPKTVGALTDEDLIKLRPLEKKKLDVQGKLYLSPLAEYGSLPFRRMCKRFGADITCGGVFPTLGFCRTEIPCLLTSLHRHETEDFFGIQLQVGSPGDMVRCAELISMAEVDFVEIRADCGSSSVCSQGKGKGLMRNHNLRQMVRGMDHVLNVPLTVKLRSGHDGCSVAHDLIPRLRDWGVSAVTLHGRKKEQNYDIPADWSYIGKCAKIAAPMPLFGNGDIFSFEDANRAREAGVSGITIGRAALVKPWIFTEIKEQRHWDISARERLDMLKDFTDYGLEYWGTNTFGVEKTRIGLLRWLSVLCRYIPLGLLEHLPPTINDQPPDILYGDYLENLLSSREMQDWVKISEMFLGPVPDNFSVLPYEPRW